MPQDHSFDMVCKVDIQEVRNAVQMALKEAGQRYDFRGTVVEILFDEKANTIFLRAANDLTLKALVDMLFQKFVRRGISLKAFEQGPTEPRTGDTLAQTLTIQQGIPQEKGRAIVKAIKDLRLKVQPSIHDDKVKVSAPKIDDLQQVIAALRAQDFGVPLTVENYR
ncbi:MAG: YajQ family cyclic di-GMP-binding protein [Omnitrophica WOR_2 bacterium RIFCSPHIGHO2_02_FULL_68_15]|nr:MAG: YajQ family cyclic di-GMP-binding protein [Omnitrophica WOR_2 bacterium RIFCSPHIGHO2_02_FULL_68_15]